MTITERLQALANVQKTHSCVTTFADGTTSRLDQPSRIQCENHAILERRKIGRDLIDRWTGKTVRVVSVEVVAI